MSRLVIEEVCGAEALFALGAEWQTLFRASAVSPFLSWEWMVAWQAQLAAAGRPRILCARADDKLVGLLPLSEEEQRLMGLPLRVRKLTFLGERFGAADYLDVLAAPGRWSEAAGAIFEHLEARGAFDVLDLDGLAEDSPSIPLLERRFAEHAVFRYRRVPRYVCPQVELKNNWEEVLKRSRRADNFKRRLRQLRELDGTELRVVTRPEEVAAAFERFLALHEKRWAAVGGSDATGHPALKAFHREAVRRLAEAGLVRFEELWVEGGCRASIYGLETGERFCFYQSGYDPEWARRSVGLVLLGLSIRDAVARGLKVYDFLRGEEGYKFDWATGTRQTVAVRVTSRRPPVRLLLARERAEAAAVRAAQALLPGQAVEILRRWRRSQKRNPRPRVEGPEEASQGGLSLLPQSVPHD